MVEIGFRRVGALARDTIFDLYRRMETDECAPADARMTRETLAGEWFGTYRAEALLAERGREVVGFALCLPGLPTPRFPTALYVAAEYVTPECRKAGIGRAFFVWFADRARALGRDQLLFCCFKRNVGARAFVNHLGATPVGERLWTSPMTGTAVPVELYTLPIT